MKSKLSSRFVLLLSCFIIFVCLESASSQNLDDTALLQDLFGPEEAGIKHKRMSNFGIKVKEPPHKGSEHDEYVVTTEKAKPIKSKVSQYKPTPKESLPSLGRSMQKNKTDDKNKKDNKTSKPAKTRAFWMSNSDALAKKPRKGDIKSIKSVPTYSPLNLNGEIELLMNGESCTTSGGSVRECIEEAKCFNSVCTCKDPSKYGLNCESSFTSFFAKALQPSTSKLTIEGLVKLQNRVTQALEKFEKKMTLQHKKDCALSDHRDAEKVVEYFGNLAKIDMNGMDKILRLVTTLNANHSLHFCDFRQFLKCRIGKKGDSKCRHWSSGVVKVKVTSGKKVYKIRIGSKCGVYPKIFDSFVRQECVNGAVGNCGRENPGICQLWCTGPNCKKRRRRKKKKGKDGIKGGQHKNGKNEQEIISFQGLRYGQPCTHERDCSVEHNMTCMADHFALRSMNIEQSSRLKGDIHDEVAIAIEEDLDYAAQGREREVYAQPPKKHFLCNCKVGYAPMRAPNNLDMVICKTAGGYRCTNFQECASGHCIHEVCQLDTKYMIFLPVGTSGSDDDDIDDHFFDPGVKGQYHDSATSLNAQSFWIIILSALAVTMCSTVQLIL